jgi:hypothetical protein
LIGNKLRQLPEFLFERHLREQRFYALLDRRLLRGSGKDE